MRLNILVACEMSGRVRAALHKRGHFAVSCDLEESTENWHGFNPRHYRGDVFEVLEHRVRPFYNNLNAVQWDALIAFPPCTHLSGSGARWCTDHWVTKKNHPEGGYWHDGTEKRRQRADAYEFFMALWNAKRSDGEPIPRVVIENPVGVMSTLFRQPDQIIQPWQYWHLDEPGKGEMKKTCLWTRGVPRLVPTTPDEPGRHQACWRMPPSKDRAMLRSLTYHGIADAIASQMFGDA